MLKKNANNVHKIINILYAHNISIYTYSLCVDVELFSYIRRRQR